MSILAAARRWTKAQWGILITLVLTHFFNGMCVSLQAPFYPAEAEKKGATASEYGLVFGIFELTVFLVSPLVGKYLHRIGVQRAFSVGICITGAMCIVFGILNYIEDSTQFIACSFVVRILEAFGNSAFLTASFSLVAHQFHSTVSSVFALVEMSFGFGMILGPTLGGLLFQVGGYTLPFAVLGSVLIVQAVLSGITLRVVDGTDYNEEDGPPQLGVLKALSIPREQLAILAVFVASISIGFLQATLERHMVQFSLSPVQIGVVFMVYGVAYALPNPFWGWITDKIDPRFVMIIGSVLISIGFLFIGPVPGLGLTTSYDLIMTSVVISGMGLGALLVSSFTEAHRSTIAAGCRNDMKTYALVSSLWTSAFALGAFVGPTAAGLLYDHVGFDWSTLFTTCWNLLVTSLTTVSLILTGLASFRRRKYSLIPEAVEDYGTLKTEVTVSMNTPNIGEIERDFLREPSYQTL